MRKNTFISLLATFVLLAVPALGQAASKTSRRSAGEQQVLVLLNQVREQHGLSLFTPNAQLHLAARFHSDDMLQKGYFDHNSPTETYGARISHYLASPLTGETIARGFGLSGSPAALVSQWMHSPAHRAVILAPGMRRVGLGIAIGTFNGMRNVVMATADFAA